MNLLTSLLLWRGSGLSISSLDVNFLNAMSLFFPLSSRLSSTVIGSPREHRGNTPDSTIQDTSDRAGTFARDYLPRFAPYLLRLRLRPSTPRASRVPRTMW